MNLSKTSAQTARAVGNTAYVYLAAIVAATSGLLFGFDIAVINGAILFLRSELHLDDVQTEFAVSALLFGCIFGASFAGWLSDRLGRRRVLMMSAALFALSALGAAIPITLTEFVAARLAGGLAIGAASVLAPLYIAEVAPAKIRGRLVAMNQMAIVSGILLAYLANWLLAFTGPSSWRWMFAVAVVPSAAFLVGLFFVPESPRWLVENDRDDEAHTVLSRINGPVIAAAELDDIKQAVAEESGALAELFRKGLRRPFFIAISLAILQQITGINTVLFYGSIIFKDQVHSASSSSAMFANVIVGLVNFGATIVALGTIDKLGRRPLLMLSSGAMAVCEVGLAVAFLGHPPSATFVLAMMLLCVAAFAIGLGPGVWVLIAEIFPTRIRGRAMSIATVWLWIACTVLTMTFLSLANAVTPTGAFLIYAAMCLVTFLIVWFAVPETRGKSLEQIERLWSKG